MFDIDAAIEARRERPHAAEGAPAQPDAWRYREAQQLHRRWLALYRGDRWSLERIARFDGATLGQVWCGIVLALRHERRPGQRRLQRRAG